MDSYRWRPVAGSLAQARLNRSAKGAGTGHSPRYPKCGKTQSDRLLGAAEGLEDALLGSRRDCVAGERLLILVRPRENRQQFLEQRKVLTLDSRIERSLHTMIARNEARIDASHRLGALARPTALARQARPPPRRPSVIGRRVGKRAADSGVRFLIDSGVAQLAKGQREVGPILMHRREPCADEIEIAVFGAGDSQLLAHAGDPVRLETLAKRGNRFAR